MYYNPFGTVRPTKTNVVKPKPKTPQRVTAMQYAKYIDLKATALVGVK